MTKKLSELFLPRALRADRACDYLGMGKSKFLDLVSQGRLPKAVRIDGITTWDRLELDAAYDAMKQDDAEIRSNPIEEHYGINR